MKLKRAAEKGAGSFEIVAKVMRCCSSRVCRIRVGFFTFHFFFLGASLTRVCVLEKWR